MPGKWYGPALRNAFIKRIDLVADTIKLQLHTSSYTPDAVAHDFQNDLTNEVAQANGYTTGGVTLGSKSLTYTAADSWATARANTTAYLVGDVVRPASANGHLYECVTAGTSAGSAPTWPTDAGKDVTDGTVVWTEAGSGITVFTSAAMQITSLSGQVTYRHAVLVDTTPGTSATNPLIAYHDYGVDQGANSQISITPHATLGWAYIFSR